MTQIQSTEDLESFYSVSDPWKYYENPDDRRRRIELLSLLPRRRFQRVLDIGCGNGFITFSLPGDAVLGIDISPKAIEWARAAVAEQAAPARFEFACASLLERDILAWGQFDLIVITGVLYPQYIGKATSLARCNIDKLLAPSGIVASCHIREWVPVRLPYSLLDTSLYPYREFTHQIEIYLNDPALS